MCVVAICGDTFALHRFVFQQLSLLFNYHLVNRFVCCCCQITKIMFSDVSKTALVAASLLVQQCMAQSISFDYYGFDYYSSAVDTANTAMTVFYVCLVLGIVGTIGGILLCVFCCCKSTPQPTGGQPSMVVVQGGATPAPVAMGVVAQPV